jgi:hypothetical protein
VIFLKPLPQVGWRLKECDRPGFHIALIKVDKFARGYCDFGLSKSIAKWAALIVAIPKPRPRKKNWMERSK